MLSQTTTEPRKLSAGQVQLIASGDLRLSANQVCWQVQSEMESQLNRAIEKLGFETVRAHDFDESEQHGFIASQRQGLEVFRTIDPEAPLIVAEAVWQYSHHVLAGLTTHRGPILTVANWSGTWPGLVGMLNLNGSLTKAGVSYSTLWSSDFQDEYFLSRLETWLKTGECVHEMNHVAQFDGEKLSDNETAIATQLADELKGSKAIMGVFDEGCMGMFNAILPDHLLNRTGVFKERLSQSALYYESTQVSDAEAEAVYNWFVEQGMKFELGDDHDTQLTREQILRQCRMYIAAVRIADDFGCDLIGIQYQQGLKDLMPASDLAEGTLNNTVRPVVKSRCGSRVLFDGQPVIHFNEVDEGAGLDALLTNRVHAALEQPVETTLHDIRWGGIDSSGTVSDYVWVFLISGAAPPEHFIDGWAGARGYRQPAMYFPNGGSSLCGVSKPGEIVWSRIFVEDDRLKMDIGRGHVVELPDEETQRRWQATTYQWPIMHAVLHDVDQNQLMAKHKSNHIQVAYAKSAADADAVVRVKSGMAAELGLDVQICGAKSVLA
ncbi:MAG: L-fucose/L-arabinose isomerase family protein [Fuerstiella sp.]|nr:L-fucose/L-arabinose isomerase family protein [Fuerstiella sp.]